MSEQAKKQFHIHSRFLHPTYACIARPHWSKNIVVPVLNWQPFGRRVIRGPVIMFKDEPIRPRFAGAAGIAPREQVRQATRRSTDTLGGIADAKKRLARLQRYRKAKQLMKSSRILLVFLVAAGLLVTIVRGGLEAQISDRPACTWMEPITWISCLRPL